jgi:hypothetical protein
MTGQLELDAALIRTHNWYEETGNPLYAWEAIVWCLNAEEPQSLPDWCTSYLRDTAENLYRLSCGKDFRDPSSGERISPDKAAKLVSNALSISRQGKNAFASLLRDRDDSRSALAAAYHGPGAGVAETAWSRNVTSDSAKRRVKRGNRLLGVKCKTS